MFCTSMPLRETRKALSIGIEQTLRDYWKDQMNLKDHCFHLALFGDLFGLKPVEECYGEPS